MKVETRDLIPALENKHDHDKHRTTNATLYKVQLKVFNKLLGPGKNRKISGVLTPG